MSLIFLVTFIQIRYLYKGLLFYAFFQSRKKLFFFIIFEFSYIVMQIQAVCNWYNGINEMGFSAEMFEVFT